jgi:2,3-bisphosphoglycerate-independent phosphoglycerate mutase
MGLLSSAGVHSNQDHIHAYMKAAAQHGIKRIFIHAFLDGRDTQPHSADYYLKKLDGAMTSYGATLASLHGRFYAMDRDNNWDRTFASYNVLTQTTTHTTRSWETVLGTQQAKTESEEFLKPIALIPDGIIQIGDGVIFANLRADRARQLTACFVDPKQIPQPYIYVHPLFFATPIVYGKNLPTNVLFPAPLIHNTLKEMLSKAHRTIFSIAESEKYAHITYFFNGENEDVVHYEVRHLIPSKPVHDYSTLPAMSSFAITKALILSLQNDPKDFYLVNYANPDMVGHSGNFAATVEALTLIDMQLGQLYDLVVKQMKGTLFITSDHGKAESMIDPQSGMPMTGHTTNDVPFLMIHGPLNGEKTEQIVLPLTQLADIAPFILNYMGIPIPPEMQK